MSLDEAFNALGRDLIDDSGPAIATMRNYRFAIVQYDPSEELELRKKTWRLSNNLVAAGWAVLTIDLERLLLDRIAAEGESWGERVASTERAMTGRSPEQGLSYLRNKLGNLIEGPAGIAADCAKLITEYTAANPNHVDRTVVLIGRAGALYPFFRSSALLRYLDGQTGHVPVVLLYPGTRSGQNGLSFMGKLPPDSDYRPRIYA